MKSLVVAMGISQPVGGEVHYVLSAGFLFFCSPVTLCNNRVTLDSGTKYFLHMPCFSWFDCICDIISVILCSLSSVNAE